MGVQGTVFANGGGTMHSSSTDPIVNKVTKDETNVGGGVYVGAGGGIILPATGVSVEASLFGPLPVLSFFAIAPAGGTLDSSRFPPAGATGIVSKVFQTKNDKFFGGVGVQAGVGIGRNDDERIGYAEIGAKAYVLGQITDHQYSGMSVEILTSIDGKIVTAHLGFEARIK